MQPAAGFAWLIAPGWGKTMAMAIVTQITATPAAQPPAGTR
jgi:hypothetical protein